MFSAAPAAVSFSRRREPTAFVGEAQAAARLLNLSHIATVGFRPRLSAVAAARLNEADTEIAGELLRRYQ